MRTTITSIIAVFFVISLLPYTAHAEPEDTVRWYIGGKLGYSGIILQDITNTTAGIPSIEYSKLLSTFVLGGTVGLQTPIRPKLYFRGELEYLYRFDTKTAVNNTGSKYELTFVGHSLLANIYFDYYLIEFVALYIGGGIGTSILEVDSKRTATSTTYNASSTQFNFAWQLGIGTRVNITEYIMADLGVRYIDLGRIAPFGSKEAIRMSNSSSGAIEVLLSVGYLF